jgi:uncharacterized protein (UPF0262 family)
VTDATSDPTRQIVNVVLDERTVVRRSPEVEHERAAAIFDLLEGNRFSLSDGAVGPYNLHLGIEENRLILAVHGADDQSSARFQLPLVSFRRIVKDYFTVCESYYAAIKKSSPAQIEAIDMGRRGLHNEGAELLRERLAGKIELDEDTARRLFTLICVLHIRG